jgi:ABC-type dipeptide transport system, periplasmic component
MKLKPRTEGGPPRFGSGLKAAALGAALACSPSFAFAEWDASNTVTVVDTSPVNWLSVTWNTMEELVRVDHKGNLVPGLAESWKWIDDRTVEFKLRKGVTFQDGEPLNAKVFRKSFDEVQRWENPHPPGAFLNFDKATKLDIVDDYTVRFTFPKPDGAAIMKFRGMHIGSSAFWDKLAFIDAEKKSAEGHW